jgi:hypothetical protein
LETGGFAAGNRRAGLSPAARRWAFLALAALLLLSRLQARQATVWEWDDVIFGVSMSVFAPQSGVPQAPFYPGFVFLGRAVNTALSDPILALTCVSVASSCAALIFLYLYLVELLGRRRDAATATLIFAFLPPVWLHAGVPLSDPAGLAAAMGACWLSLRARRAPALIPLAALAFGVAVSVRPQTALIAVYPLARCLIRARLRWRALGAAVAAASVSAFYVAPIILAGGGVAGPERFFRYQTGFVLGTDSLLAHGRSVRAVLVKYLVAVWGTPLLAFAILALLAYGAKLLLSRNRPALVELLATFMPYALLCWLFLDPSTGGRYCIPYIPLVALLVGTATVELDRRIVPRALPVVSAIVISWSAATIWPAVHAVHTRPSPPVVAARAIRRAVGHEPFGIVYGSGLYPHSQWLFPGVPSLKVAEVESGAHPLPPGGSWWRFGVPDADDATAASFPDLAALKRVGRGRYLTVPFGPFGVAPATYGNGWSRRETTTIADGTKVGFRWASQRASAQFPRLACKARLAITARAQLSPLRAAPEVRLIVDGVEVGRFTASAMFSTKAFELPDGLLHSDALNAVEVLSGQALVPSDARTAAQRDRRHAIQVQSLRIVPD